MMVWLGQLEDGVLFFFLVAVALFVVGLLV
jgi:hypothetical protein